MKTIILSVFCSIIACLAFGQDAYLATTANAPKGEKVGESTKTEEISFEFYDYSSAETENIDYGSFSGSHLFGSEIAYKFKEFNDLYALQSPIGPGNPGMKTVIQKPEIYNSIQKLNKGLKKQVKKGEISEEVAKKELAHSLDVAVAIVAQDTEKFETELKQAASVSQIRGVYRNTVLKQL